MQSRGPFHGHKAIKRFGKTEVLAFALIVMAIFFGGFFYLNVHSTRILFFTAFACVAVAGLWAWQRFFVVSFDEVFSRMFPVVLVVLGLVFAVFFPPGAVPDGIYHFRTAYVYSNILSFQDADTMRAVDYETFFEDGVLAKSVDREHWETTQDSFELFSSNGELNPDSSVSDELVLPMAQLKVPAALGILLARLLGLGAIPLFYLGRIFNMLFSAALIIAAVRLTPVGRNCFMAVALMPMTLHLMGSYSYDGPLIAMASLLIALLLKAICDEGAISKGLCVAIVVVAVLLAPCKLVYVFVSFIALFVPSRRFESRVHAALFKAIVIVVPIAMICVTQLAALNVHLSGEQSGDAEGESGGFYTTSMLLAHPRSTLELFVNSLLFNPTNYCQELVGGILGWLQGTLMLPTWISFLLFYLLLFTSIRTKDDDRCLPVKLRIMFVAVFACVVMALLFTMCISWTPTTDQLIQGVQGRYFLPVIVLLLLAMRSMCIRVHANVGFALMMTLAGFDLVYLAYVVSRALLV